MSDPNPFHPVSVETLAAFQAQRVDIVSAVVAAALQRHAEVAQHGTQAARLLTAGLDFTTQALEVAMQLNNTEILRQQLDWAHDRLPFDGVEPAHILSRLRLLAEAIAAALSPPQAAEVNQFVHWMIEHQQARMAQTAK